MFEHWYSSIAGSWLVADRATGELCGYYPTEALLLRSFDSELSTVMGD